MLPKRFFVDLNYILSLGDRKRNITLYVVINALNLLQGAVEGASYLLLLIGISKLVGSDYTLEPKFLQPFNLAFPAYLALGISVQLFKSLLALFNAFLGGHLTKRVQMGLQEKMLNRVYNLKYEKVNAYRSGELIECCRYPISVIPQLMIAYHAFFSMILVAVPMFFLLLYLSWQLCLVVLGAGVVMLGVQRITRRKLIAISKDNLLNINNIISKMVEVIGGLKLVHLFNLRKHFRDEGISLSEKSCRFGQREFVIMQIPAIVAELVSILLVGACFLFAILFWKEALALYFPLLITFVGVAYRLSGKINAGASNYLTINNHYVQIDRCKEFLEDTKKDVLHEPHTRLKSFKNRIEFRDVSFCYPGTENPIFESFSFEVEKGKTIGIVGDSGAGKSTLLDLLLGLYMPSEGEILVDDVALDKVNLTSWRNHIGVVSQDMILFNDTLRNNVMLGNLSASEVAFTQAVKKAKVDEFVQKLQDKYETRVGERGHRLSGGEKQRLSLARALVRDPSILVLDEATSHLDSISEKFIQDSIEALIGEKTLIVVAHRLSTLMHADVIYVLQNGRIVEKGTHEEMLENGGVYASMWHTQFKSDITREWVPTPSLSS
ncbi:MAG: ABC transporter ATP-binding protein [Chlamydiales bacterium]|nr:ABC transporter ATP-binding protein [Chlamydiales bacterium]